MKLRFEALRVLLFSTHDLEIYYPRNCKHVLTERLTFTIDVCNYALSAMTNLKKGSRIFYHFSFKWHITSPGMSLCKSVQIFQASEAQLALILLTVIQFAEACSVDFDNTEFTALPT